MTTPFDPFFRIRQPVAKGAPSWDERLGMEPGKARRRGRGGTFNLASGSLRGDSAVAGGANEAALLEEKLPGPGASA